MKKYLKTAKKRHWLLIIILLSVSFYLPFLIFGAYPFATKTNLSEEAIRDLTSEINLPNYYDSNSSYQKTLPKLTKQQKVLEENAFKNWDGGKCRFCHSIKSGDRDRMAPNLNQIFGKPAGVAKNFTYSEALIQQRESGLMWTPETIDGFISNPQQYIPGNRMKVEGIEDEATRKLIINHLLRESK
ncbi:MAG: hypothetical protein HOK34_06095 [Gammaproteobacteria bacterium]|jgi:cytochrome c2|nr:hypothetical protein [Gammaproteobacteria bacterium]